MTSREQLLVKAFAQYLVQSGVQSSQAEVLSVLAQHQQLADSIIAFFHEKFGQAQKLSPIDLAKRIEEINAKISNLSDADAAKMFSQCFEVFNSVKRTNYYLNKPYISLKVMPKEISFSPEPRPFTGIFVYSDDFEGAHLRGGKIARGGIRWSERKDYRFEILELMRTQVVKNAIIVPTGAKGGFIVKKGEPHDETIALECYKSFLRALLDLTDNIVNGKVVKPKGVHCYDDDDPYLVVAADKGTANFSDTANQIAAEYNFWLGDAFASGGKHGYNHKDLQITSKGAWVSAELHLRNLGIDPEDGFTCVGVGGMSGDVFGNFMLFEPKMKLIAAFSHAYIFVDPNPDCKASFVERSRMFKLPHAQWSDYTRSIISKGGGIFSRSDKEIPLTQEMKKALSITSQASMISPDELIKAILRAPVDLMFQGGIGTYVKAESETKIHDKPNESIRVNGKEIRARSVVEGANLSFTQLGRIEYARGGGVINTDFIDNSGGVDCSDHEVNIKILLNSAMADGVITLEERNRILREATTDVVAAVLSDNLTQNLLISQEQQISEELTKGYAEFMKHLEEIGMLNRQVEKLPDDATMRQMAKDKVGLTRPELAVLASYAKQHMESLLKTVDLTQIPELEECLVWYFPTNISTNPKLLPYISKHKLANEIIGTVISNFFVNTTGILELYEAHVRGGHSLTSILLSFIEAQTSEHEGCSELCTHSH